MTRKSAPLSLDGGERMLAMRLSETIFSGSTRKCRPVRPSTSSQRVVWDGWGIAVDVSKGR